MDGRGINEIRPLAAEVGILPRVHGSGMFTRGQTQVLTTCTLGGTKDNQLMDDLTDEQTKRYIHHYNFPPYSVGEARAPRSPGRREIGHGALAERALVPVLPSWKSSPTPSVACLRCSPPTVLPLRLPSVALRWH